MAYSSHSRNILQLGNTNNQNHNKTKAWKEVAEVVNASNLEGAKRLPAGCRKRRNVSMEMDIVLHYSHVGLIMIHGDDSVIAYSSSRIFFLKYILYDFCHSYFAAFLGG